MEGGNHSLRKRLFSAFDELESNKKLETLDLAKLAVRFKCQEDQVDFYFKQRYAVNVMEYRRIKRQKRQTNKVKSLMQTLPRPVKDKLLELAIRYIQSGDYQFYRLMQKVYDEAVE
jgi:AraC-like DNA-binding protein